MIATAADALWSTYFATRSRPARDALVEHYLATNLPKKVLGLTLHGRVKQSSQYYVSVEGLLSSAHVGLIAGIERYDPARGTKPETFLSKKMRGAILDELRTLDPLTRRDRERVNKGLMEQPKITSPLLMSMIERARMRDGGGDGGIDVGVAADSASDAVDLKAALRTVFGRMTPQQAEALVANRLERLSLRDIVALRRARARLTRFGVAQDVDTGGGAEPFGVAYAEKFLLALRLLGLSERRRRMSVPCWLWRTLSEAHDKWAQWERQVAARGQRLREN